MEAFVFLEVSRRGIIVPSLLNMPLISLIIILRLPLQVVCPAEWQIRGAVAPPPSLQPQGIQKTQVRTDIKMR